MVAVPFDRAGDEIVFNITDINDKVVLQIISSPKNILEDVGIHGSNQLSVYTSSICEVTGALSTSQARVLNIKNYTFSKDCKLIQLVDGNIETYPVQSTPFKGI